MRRLFSVSLLIGLLVVSLPAQAGSVDGSADDLLGAPTQASQFIAKAAPGLSLTSMRETTCTGGATNRVGLRNGMGGLELEEQSLANDLASEMCGIASCPIGPMPCSN